MARLEFWRDVWLLACVLSAIGAVDHDNDDSTTNNDSINNSVNKEKLFTIVSASASTPVANNCSCVNEHTEVECRCTGHNFFNIPSNLTNGLSTLIIEDAGLEVLKRDSLSPYSETLRELTLVGLEKFYYFEPGVFRNLSELETLYIHRAPKLLKIQPEVFSASLPKLKILRIVNTGLEEMPNLNGLNTASVLHMIDLEHNHIQRIKRHQISRVKTDQLLLNYNNIRTVEEEAFYGSEIAKLSLKGNVQLANLHRRAFGGLKSLTVIDLSNTAITAIPIEGLREIEVLKVQETNTLKVFPSVYNFQYIKEAWLTYPYHCCAFKFPHTHNPREFEQHQRFIKHMQSTCTSPSSNQNATAAAAAAAAAATSGNNHGNSALKELLKLQLSINAHANVNTSYHHLLPPFVAKDVQNDDDGGTWSDDEEVFHNGTLDVRNEFGVTTAVCGEIYRNYHEVKCYPAPDAFNPCEDLMGNWGLRIPVWFISLSAIIGNLFVVIVIATSHFRLTVSKFLMCNLAAADLCIGIHLLLIAIVDACSIGTYFNYAIDWQEGDGCRVAGFLTIFGNVLSVYTLAVITTERWYTITWAIHLNKRLKLRTAVRVMFAGWVCAICMASLPLVGISSYSRTSICLPLESRGKADAIYLSTLLAFNAITFALVCICYGSMYRSIREGGNIVSVTAVRSDLTVAKRMALLVFTDFACWAPIAFFGMTALLGHPLITVTHTKILLVFFYPLNSCANPCLYALLTQQYRRDFFILMGRYGLCKDRAERHKGAIGGKPLPYGTGGQYKRSTGDTLKTHSGGHTNNHNHRGSVLTTVVSVEVPMLRNGSGSVSGSRGRCRDRDREREREMERNRDRECGNKVRDFSLKQLSRADIDECRHTLHTSTDNL